MICSSLNLLFFMSVILLVVDGLHELQTGTAGGGQVIVGKVTQAFTSTEVAKSCEENLESREPLLAVDHAAPLDAAGLRLPLVEHHRAEEVNWCVGTTLDELHELARDVLPQWRPLVLLLPDVLPLEHRHLESHLLLEDVQQRDRIRVH